MSFSANELRLVIAPESSLLTGTHRIFLANVLGLDPSQKPLGYVRKGVDATPQLFEEVLGYLREQGFAPSLSPGATNAAAELQQDREAFGDARERGRHLKDHPTRPPLPEVFKRDLKSYQKPAVAHLAGVRHAANFSVPGSGKTTITLAAFALLRQGGEVDRIVVVGPRAAFMPWEEEFRECFGRKPRSTRLVGSKTRRKRLYRVADGSDIVLLTYQMASNDLEDLVKYFRRHKVMLVLDESHNVKRLAGGRWSESLLSLAPFAARRVILSGTPAPHSLLDLWTQVSFLWPGQGLLGEREQFRRRVETDEDSAFEGVREELYPFYWRIRKSDLRLPRPRFHRISIRMSPYQRAIYDAIAARVLADSIHAPEERLKLRMWRRARMVRLLQAASNPALLTTYSTEFKIPPVEGSGLPVESIIEHYPDYETPEKFAYTVALVRKLVAKGHKVLVWTAFVHNIKMLEARLADLSPACVWGGVPKDDDEDEEYNRERLIREFRTSPRRTVMIANPSACAESVSLHNACFHAVYFDRTFNAAHYLQSLDRIHRVGVTRPVHYYLLQSENSIDSVIDERLSAKTERMLKLLNDDFMTLDLDSPIDEFSEAAEEDRDFQALIESLRTHAVGSEP